MTLRQEFKACLLNGWLSHRVWQIAAMIMLDHKIRYACNTIPDDALVENFLRDIKVPPYGFMLASVYLAAFYPKTSSAMFQNKSTALQIFWKETQRTPDATKTLRHERANKNRQDKRIRFIKLRELAKDHDWKTVK